MIDRSEDARADRVESASVSRHTRVIIMLVALCCLCMGIAIGAIMRGIAGARPEDNRLAISSNAATPDSLSAIFARVSEVVEPSVVHIKIYENEVYNLGREGTGSGVIVNSAGFIITNQHVIKRATRIKVRLATGGEYDAKVIGQDSQTDLAVIKIEAKEALPVARMGDSDKLSVGDWVLAIGSPFGLEQTVTAGIISAKDRITESGSTPFQQFLQTDAAINPGNSGGPLVNLAGEVIGINTQIATASGVYNGIGFALPSSTAVDIYNQLVTNGRVRRGYLGIELDAVTPQVARLNKIQENQGALVERMADDSSPAAKAGIQSGDVIVTVNGQKVKNVRDLVRRIASLPVGTLATIGYVRNGEQRTASVKLEERPEESADRLNIKPLPFDPNNPRGVPKKDEKTPEDQSRGPQIKPRLGIGVRTLTAELAKTRGLEGARGALINAIEPGSVADDNDIRPDDLIIEINYRPVNNQEDFLSLTRDLKSGDDVAIKVLRKDRRLLRSPVIVSFTMP